MKGRGRWQIGLLLALLATALRVAWALAVPTIPVGDFATYRESAIYLAEFGRLDGGFVYMPGWVWLLSLVHHLGGELRASKLLGAVLGGLAAGPIFVVTARLMDNGWAGPRGQSRDAPLRGPAEGQQAAADRSDGGDDGSGGGGDGDTVAWVAGLAYACWPAGIALASVVGTDLPTAAVLVSALMLLCVWGDTRPLLASASFGAAMGVAAYFRAVALPLTVLSGVYWIAMRAGARATVTRVALAVAMTIVVLLPWGLRNLARDGEFYLTDSHGGITAMMGNYPNSEGTHSRSLADLFREVTGRTLLMEPHRQTDRAAYAVAKEWITFDPAWTAGMIALRTERLFALEHGLLYWSIYRRGVLPPAAAGWFNQHRPFVVGVTDIFYWLFAVGLIAGVAAAVSRRRLLVLVPVPFAAVLAATYALFVAEPRYRLSTEVLLFPLAAFGAVRAAQLAGRLAAMAMKRTVLSDGDRRSLRALGVVALAVAIAGALVVRGGAALRDRHRWAATVWRVNGRAQLALWRRAPDSPPGSSPVRGGSPGALVTVRPGQEGASAEIVLPRVVLPPGRFQVAARVSSAGDTIEPLLLTFLAAGEHAAPALTRGAVFVPSASPSRAPPEAGDGDVALIAARVDAAGGAASIAPEKIEHRGGAVRFWAHLQRPAAGPAAAAALVTDVSLVWQGLDAPIFRDGESRR